MKLFYCSFSLVLATASGFTILTANINKYDSISTALYARNPNPVFPVQNAPVNTAAAVSPAINSNTDRRPIVAGNWKLNPSTKKEAIELLNGLKAGGGVQGSEVVIFPPLPYLSDAITILAGTGIGIGAQNAGSNTKGAFTGEIAPSMLASAGCSHVLLGHSERRTLFGESDASINERVQACLVEPTLNVVLCVGETLAEYEIGLLKSVVDTQLRKGLAGVSADDLLNGRVVIAYEPVWAIGTGLVATPDQAQAAHVAIRQTLLSMYANSEVASKMRIQYGGSVTPDSVKDLMAMPDVDGALVGGASLIPDSFLKIIQGSWNGQISPF
jgi:triosephosphate isomerase